MTLGVRAQCLWHLIAIFWFAREGFPYVEILEDRVVLVEPSNTFFGLVIGDTQSGDIYLSDSLLGERVLPGKCGLDNVVHGFVTGGARSHLLPRNRIDRTHCLQLWRCMCVGTPSMQNNFRTFFNAWTFISISFLLKQMVNVSKFLLFLHRGLHLVSFCCFYVRLTLWATKHLNLN